MPLGLVPVLGTTLIGSHVPLLLARAAGNVSSWRTHNNIVEPSVISLVCVLQHQMKFVVVIHGVLEIPFYLFELVFHRLRGQESIRKVELLPQKQGVLGHMFSEEVQVPGHASVGGDARYFPPAGLALGGAGGNRRLV